MSIKLTFNNETRRFGFLFDGIRKIGNTLPLTKEEYALFGLTSFVERWGDSRYANISEYEWSEYGKLVRRLIATYGEHADEALSTMIVNLVTPKLNNSLTKLHYYTMKKSDELKEIIASTYDEVKDRPMYELTRSVGSGISGIAIPGGFFNTSKNRIIKRSIAPFDKCMKIFYEYCMKVGSKFLPKVYSYGDNYVEMETLKVGTEKCIKFIQEVNPALDQREKNLKHRESLYVKEWITEIGDFAKKIGLDINHFDLHEGNVGENDKGDVVLFDPIAPMYGEATLKVNKRYNKRINKLIKRK